jgi:hypothetical protein
MQSPTTSAIARNGTSTALARASCVALCSLSLWLCACSEGYAERAPQALIAARPGPVGRGGATAGVPVAGCASCAGATPPIAGVAGPAGFAPPIVPPAAVSGGTGSAIAGASGPSAGGGAGGRTVAGASGTSSAGRGGAGASGTVSAGASGGGRGGAGASGSAGRSGSGSAGRSGAGAGGSGGRAPEQCRASSCPDCPLLEQPCCQSNGRCGCRLLLLCN